jgi:hypothetical protein
LSRTVGFEPQLPERDRIRPKMGAIKMSDEGRKVGSRWIVVRAAPRQNRPCFLSKSLVVDTNVLLYGH